MAEPGYIAIEGVIGVGKTTLATILSEKLGAQLQVEEVEENPFLEKFYDDMRRYAFQTQIFFLLSRYRQQMEIAGFLWGTRTRVAVEIFRVLTPEQRLHFQALRNASETPGLPPV